MKPKNKDTKKYLLSVARKYVCFLHSYITYLLWRVYYDIIETTCVCICLLNVVTAFACLEVC